MSQRKQPKFKKYSKFGLSLSDHPKLHGGKLKSKKWQSLASSKNPRKESEFGALLIAKQRLKAFYGQLKDKQMTRLYKRASLFGGNQTIDFLKLLERRLDIILMRLKISPSLSECRQLIQHGHFLVNGKKVYSASSLLNIGDTISVKASSRKLVQERVSRYISGISKDIKKIPLDKTFERHPLLFTPNYLEFNYRIMQGVYTSLPNTSTVLFPINVKLSELTEFYKYKRKV